MSRSGFCLSVLLLSVAIVIGRNAGAQCMLANPSFELPGQGGKVFAGWNQFGSFGSTTNATHGAKAARLTTFGTSSDVSGYWQALDTVPGERWRATVSVRHPSSKPLTGQSRAILNIEWRNASDALLSYESHVVADVFTPMDQPVVVSIDSQAAPAGAVKTRLLLGVQHQPGDPPADVYYDQATFVSLTPPTVDDVQWFDFPGGRTVTFSGRTWRVKGPGYYGPGPNLFCDGSSCVWVDASGRLHMTIRKIGGSWNSTEATLEDPLGYGDYVFTVLGPPDQWHPNVVLGLFLWEYGPAGCYDPASGWWNPYNEIDVELGRWGDALNDAAQFVAQPYDYLGNIDRFDGAAGSPDTSSYAFRWLPDRVEFRSWRGGPGDESSATMIHAWTYTGPHIPRPDQPRVHVNLWQFMAPPSTDQEAVLQSFTFTPACVGPLCGPLAVTGRPAPRGPMSSVGPNPFFDRTRIRYTVARAGPVEIDVYDVAGRLVRTLERRAVEAGSHEATWDGRDAWGRRVASGVYLYRIHAGGRSETRRMVVLE